MREEPKCVIPKAYRKFDIIKCMISILVGKGVYIDGSIHNILIEKGYY